MSVTKEKWWSLVRILFLCTLCGLLEEMQLVFSVLLLTNLYKVALLVIII